MATYAANTSVSSEKSRVEIEQTLRRYGASSFGYLSEETQATVLFTLGDRRIRFTVPLPDYNSREFTHHSQGKRSDSAREDLYEKAVRQRWRALALVVKAKLEATEAGISTVEQEFYAHTVLPNNQTVWEATHESVDLAITSGSMRALEN
jgi:hypothetical protein